MRHLRAELMQWMESPFSGVAKNFRSRRAVNDQIGGLDSKTYLQLIERMLALLVEMTIKAEIIGMEEPIDQPELLEE